ncbi:hypothetical protein O181_001894 [Austropuccinia psidii MF-1]|uniref:Uncharacterized protein n=1 Tax=Austropuccinia psidii MF-1 TaxID=1389203 RepID=A0A9Q3BBD5_9BASI|nr:hypothetical protein [Austropuccinia psidii MF-1]
MSPIYLSNLGIPRNKQDDREDQALDTTKDGRTLSYIIPKLPLTFQFNRDLKPEDWKDMDQVLKLHQLLKNLFQWSMDNKRFNLASHWEELGADFQKICLKEIPLKDPMVITQRMEFQKAVQTPGGKGIQDKGESSHYPRNRTTTEPDRAYFYSFRLTSSKEQRLPSSSTPFRNQQISDQESPFFTITGTSQEKRRIKGEKNFF